MDEKIEYTEPLKGTLAETVQAKAGDELGVPFSPLSQMWQVNPGAEAVEPEALASETGKTTP
ncbi:hypothetical protein [Brevibacillus reuszeri]|uniref:hypothetical protein n=1 Tax=Brevibacillus reuszeri TaxID=54915 RepID=UPI000CCBE76D|nr:hypothetical protein [Brevibacillus reuszeri]